MRGKSSHPVSLVRRARWSERYIRIRRLKSGQYVVLLQIDGRVFRIANTISGKAQHTAQADAEDAARILAWSLDRLLDAEAPRHVMGSADRPDVSSWPLVAFCALSTLALVGCGVFYFLLRFCF